VWLADVEANLPAYNHDVWSDEREERFGKAMFGDRWVGPLNQSELTLIGYICNATSDWERPIENGRGSPPPIYVYRGPADQHKLAETAWERSRRRKDQLACVRETLGLLDRYGPSAPAQYGGGRNFDPLERLYPGDDRAELEKARDLYWRIKDEQSVPPSEVPSASAKVEQQAAPSNDAAIWWSGVKLRSAAPPAVRGPQHVNLEPRSALIDSKAHLAVPRRQGRKAKRVEKALKERGFDRDQQGKTYKGIAGEIRAEAGYGSTAGELAALEKMVARCLKALKTEE
jgi:hypothetical protein